MTWLELRLEIFKKYKSLKNIGLDSCEERSINAIFRHTQMAKYPNLTHMTALELHNYLENTGPKLIVNLGPKGAKCAQSALMKMIVLMRDYDNDTQP